MSGFKKFFLISTFLLIASIAVIFITAACYKNNRVDALNINDIAQTARQDWGDFGKIEEKFPDTDILILDAYDNRLLVTDDGAFEGINSPLDAIQHDMVSIAVTDGDLFMGTVIIPDPGTIQYNSLMHKLIAVTGAIVIVMATVYASFIYYVDHNIARPFRRMKEFAAAIAQGNLDEPLKMEKNNMFGIFTESFDMMREELKASKNREIALKMKEKELVASLSHDLKTPVTGIRVICELLEVKVEDEYVKAKISNIEQKTKEIDVLVNDLLSSSLDDLGELNVNPCEHTSDILLRTVEEHDVNRKVTSNEVPDCIIRVDRNRLSQVIGNIISNSYKYADTGIAVSYKFDGKFLRMDIRDFGSGVPEDEIDHLTSKFYRGKSNSKDKDGSGLGLYISNQLMSRMGGSLICSSYKDGFEVTLMIPLA
ncbi:MAG: HAMP domain-containing histidine kinase [Saccharofermentans sp.]|nr:HAMP domain-containing histidine kinase [Saccharofermentans sp.]